VLDNSLLGNERGNFEFPTSITEQERVELPLNAAGARTRIRIMRRRGRPNNCGAARALRLVIMLGACTALSTNFGHGGGAGPCAHEASVGVWECHRRGPPPLAGALRGGGGGGISLDRQRATLDRVNLEISMEMDDMAVRRRRFIRDETQVLDYFKPQEAALGARKPRANRRAAGRMTEREEDEALLRRTEEEEAGATVTQKMERMLPLTAQPSLLEGGVLRDYQLEGLNWMASLYVNGASGMHFSKVLYTVALHNTYSRALTLENLCQASWPTRWAWARPCRRSPCCRYSCSAERGARSWSWRQSRRFAIGRLSLQSGCRRHACSCSRASRKSGKCSSRRCCARGTLTSCSPRTK
jgi:hypothetical protein